jgi:integrase
MTNSFFNRIESFGPTVKRAAAWSDIRKRPLINKAGLPFRRARLVDYDGDLSRLWYIIFYAYDPAAKRLRRKRVGKEELNGIPTLIERRDEARKIIDALNHELEGTAQLKPILREKLADEAPGFNFRSMGVIDALSYVTEYKQSQKKSDSTLKGYRALKRSMGEFMDHLQLSRGMPLKNVNRTFIQRYLDYLRTESGIGNKTYNVAKGIFHSAVEVLRSQDTKLFPDANPVARFVNMPVVSKKHAAYTTDQVDKLRQLIGDRDQQMLLFIRFIYFTLARPKELRLLKVSDIRLDFKRILVRGEVSKTSIEEFVGISPALEDIINQSGILKYPADNYVFGIKGSPDLIPVGKNYFGKRFRVFITESQFRQLNPNYSLYSFKHTGAVQLYLATKDPYLVQRQCRHTTLDQTMTYLKDLGLFTDFSALERWIGF